MMAGRVCGTIGAHHGFMVGPSGATQLVPNPHHDVYSLGTLLLVALYGTACSGYIPCYARAVNDQEKEQVPGAQWYTIVSPVEEGKPEVVSLQAPIQEVVRQGRCRDYLEAADNLATSDSPGMVTRLLHLAEGCLRPVGARLQLLEFIQGLRQVLEQAGDKGACYLKLAGEAAAPLSINTEAQPISCT
jgi:hypothetical protein